jgi:GTPase subunit of restriction endonuclease
MEVDYLQLLEFLKNFGGEEYKAKDKRETDNDKKKYSEMEEEGKNAIKTLEKITKIDQIKKINLINSGVLQWQNSGHIKKYLWLQMKYEKYKNDPISISIFIENSDITQKPRYRFCLEVKGKDIKNKKKYHRFLNLLLPEGFVYVSGSNDDNNIKIVEGKSKDKIKEEIESIIKEAEKKKKKEINEKFQLSKIQEWNDDLENEQVEKIMLKAIETLIPYYEYVLGIKNNQDLNIENEEENVEKDIKKQFDKNVIFYGPPGTGKTYTTAKRAVAICENLVENSLIDYSEVMKKYNILKKENRIEFITFHQSYGYEEFIEGIRPVLSNENDNSEDMKEDNQVTENDIKYKIADGIFKEFCNEARKNVEKPYVFIIDEINRGNISKIFGELITLVETTKRAGKTECIPVKLLYSNEEFTVPENIYIIGTMNTADRSIALMDTALRRRFKFEEMVPNSNLLKDIFIEDKGEKVNIGTMLKIINERIEYLYDREHRIGHAVFLELKKDNNNNINKLANIFEKSVIPLLQEYFYEDYEKIRLVLGDNAKKNKDEQFILSKPIPSDIFEKKTEDIDIPDNSYSIKCKNFKNIKAYKNISQKRDLSKSIDEKSDKNPSDQQ